MLHKCIDNQIIATNRKYILNILARLIIRGSQDHALVGPQPKGNIIKGLCFQKRRPFLFGVSPGQVWAKFCVFRGKTGVNGSEEVELLEPD